MTSTAESVTLNASKYVPDRHEGEDTLQPSDGKRIAIINNNTHDNNSSSNNDYYTTTTPKAIQ